VHIWEIGAKRTIMTSKNGFGQQNFFVSNDLKTEKNYQQKP
jgi:hypothetical protein